MNTEKFANYDKWKKIWRRSEKSVIQVPFLSAILDSLYIPLGFFRVISYTCLHKYGCLYVYEEVISQGSTCQCANSGM